MDMGMGHEQGHGCGQMGGAAWNSSTMYMSMYTPAVIPTYRRRTRTQREREREVCSSLPVCVPASLLLVGCVVVVGGGGAAPLFALDCEGEQPPANVVLPVPMAPSCAANGPPASRVVMPATSCPRAWLP